MNQSPLRYPGGKTRACKILDEIICQQFDISGFDRIISPFFGGGSFEFHMQNKYKLRIIANDKFAPLANFWRTCKTNQGELVAELEKKIDRISKTDFLEYRAQDNPRTPTIGAKYNVFYNKSVFLQWSNFVRRILSGRFEK